MKRLQDINHQNLSDTVYVALCDALMKGNFKPGERLRIRELAKELGTSVTPIRDAILRLSHDDAVTFLSPRHIQVPIITPERYLEIRAIRVRLEGLAAEQAAVNITKSALDDLAKIVKRHETALGRGDGVASAELNQAFHLQLSVIAGLPTLRGVLRKLWLQMGPLLGEVYSQGDRLMVQHHLEVLEALDRKDPEAASKAIQSDITSAGDLLMRHIALRVEGGPQSTPKAA